MKKRNELLSILLATSMALQAAPAAMAMGTDGDAAEGSGVVLSKLT